MKTKHKAMLIDICSVLYGKVHNKGAGGVTIAGEIPRGQYSFKRLVQADKRSNARIGYPNEPSVF